MGIPRWYWAAAFCLFAATLAVMLILRWQVIAQTLDTSATRPQVADTLAPASTSASSTLASSEEDAAARPVVAAIPDPSGAKAKAVSTRTGSSNASKAPRTPERIPRLDLNRAGSAELQQLPGVGPVLANRIVSHRNLHGRFDKYEDLDDVKGIGAKMLEKLRPYLYVEK